MFGFTKVQLLIIVGAVLFAASWGQKNPTKKIPLFS